MSSWQVVRIKSASLGSTYGIDSKFLVTLFSVDPATLFSLTPALGHGWRQRVYLLGGGSRLFTLSKGSPATVSLGPVLQSPGVDSPAGLGAADCQKPVCAYLALSSHPPVP